jgi:phosphoserine phosphatase
MAVGDGANDIPMLTLNRGIALNAKPVVMAQAPHALYLTHSVLGLLFLMDPENSWQYQLTSPLAECQI